MSLERLVDVICRGLPSDEQLDEFGKEVGAALDGIFGSRYQKRSRHARRVALMRGEKNIPFAGLVHEASPDSGVYGGMSLVWFPVGESEEGPAGSLLTFVCGTRGLSPDEHILGRPGHARHLQALRRYLAHEHGVAAWAKHDPASLSEPFPDVLKDRWKRFGQAIGKYGNWIYAAVEVPADRELAREVVAAFLDFYAWERGWVPLQAARDEVEALKNALRRHMFPRLSREEVEALLQERRFVVLQGPPGTGKTRLALEIMREAFGGRGRVVQFHPAVTYETFVAGISPDVRQESLRFEVREGWLTRAAREARDGNYLLVIDEINRADLGRVLGEAIYLFEAMDIARGEGRKVTLPHVLPDGSDSLELPEGLFILGTMNSADRSIAILDLAVRRRFAFVDAWPDLSVVEAQGLDLATEAFGRLLEIFAQYAPDDALVLVPGHAYFLASDPDEFARRMRFELVPLLREYLQEGRLGPCESELRAYLDWLEGELALLGRGS